MPIRITTCDEAFDMLNIRPNDRIKGIIARLAGEGRSERSICFAMWKSQDKIRQFRGDSRFYSVLENEIKKWSWSSKDPRWVEYNKRKEEERQAKLVQEEAVRGRERAEKAQADRDRNESLKHAKRVYNESKRWQYDRQTP
jgi:hypothetical protein